jgi:hypothetical protein
MPQIPAEHEQWILLLMNVLMIEVKAESFFSFCQSVMRDPDNFRDRRDAAASLPRWWSGSAPMRRSTSPILRP